MTRRLMRGIVGFVVTALALVFVATAVRAEDAKPQAADLREMPPVQALTSVLNRWAEVAQPSAEQAPRTFVTRVRVVKAEGLPGAVDGLVADVAYQAPDRL